MPHVKQLLLALLFIAYPLLSHCQDKSTAQATWLNAKGKEVNEKKVFKSCLKQQIVFFGEQHNDSLAHTIQLKLLQYLDKKVDSLCLAMEMFELDVQLVLNEYLNGLIKEKNFIEESRAWSNYKEDYAPLVNYSKESSLPVYASNIPRRYASSVFYHGLEILDSFPSASKKYFPPKPYSPDTSLYIYKSLTEMSMPGHMSENLVKAQALKDAAMGATIARLLKNYTLVYHINGNYHSRYQSGIIHYLTIYAGSVKTLSIQTIDSVDAIQKEKLQADFYLLSPED